MSDLKQVKVDNWGIYFLQRLKHFFNRTDYCDLTLQFQDNAQLKVHRLVINACTEYFEILERTCEMYEDCLVMPDDLQADVVVPIVNFMYTGQLEFKPESLEKLYQTSQVMNMPVLTKLLDAHRSQAQRPAPTHSYSNIKHYSKSFNNSRHVKHTSVPSTSNTGTKRSYSRAFSNNVTLQKNKKQNSLTNRQEKNVNQQSSQSQSATCSDTIEYPVFNSKKQNIKDPRPTRYELPEELDGDNIFDNSFTSISYTSQPLMVHPETVKRYTPKKAAIFEDAISTKRIIQGSSTLDIVECKKINVNENIFEDDASQSIPDENEIFQTSFVNSKDEQKDASQLFDQILDSETPKVTIETRDLEKNNQATKLDHAKIISEVLKKYPHLVKSNKNIKLKILNTPSKSKKSRTVTNVFNEEKEVKPKVETPDFTYETDVIDSKEAAKLIAMGAENTKGPWICLICGTPGRALHFTSYYKFRRHLVEVHNEKPIPNICEYCGLKSFKRNYILHHLYTKHGVEPPPQYHFPKCNLCNYVALTEGFLVKHKLTHTDNRQFGCNVCSASFNSSSQLLVHIQKTGHKYSAEKKINLQCIYCLKTFSRETNLYAHLKTHHKQSAQADGIIDDSDEEKHEENLKSKSENFKNMSVKYEVPVAFENEYENIDVQYQIQQKPDGNIHVVSKSPQATISKHKILNPGFNTSPEKSPQNLKAITNNRKKHEFLQDNTMSLIQDQNDEIVTIDGNEYIVRNNELIPPNTKSSNEEYILSNVLSDNGEDNSVPATSMNFSNLRQTNFEDPKSFMKKLAHINNQPIQIVVSNEEQYKALISSNHSIIFEEADANKTLTVLTAQPHNTSLEGATIDLENTQSNDMMIIQEEYPLNVTEAVSADNSNIVVVYSHPVDDQNKQYQYITSQDIETQFVQSSAIITQNFETITTSTAVMAAQSLDTQVVKSWQNNNQENITNLPFNPQLPQIQLLNQQKPIIHLQNVSDHTSELPEISLTKNDESIVPTTVSTEQEINNPQDSAISNIEIGNNLNPGILQEIHTIPQTCMDVEVPSEPSPHSEIITENTSEENCQRIEVLAIKTDSKDNKDVTEQNISNSNLNMVEQSTEETNTSNHTLGQTIENVDEIILQNTGHDSKSENENEKIQDLEKPMSNTITTIPKVVKEKIKKLTLEWSEDESDTVKTVITDCTETKSMQHLEEGPAESPAEIEESIENIQQEMAKQMAQAVSEYKTNTQDEEIQAVVTTVEPILEPENNVAIIITTAESNTEKDIRNKEKDGIESVETVTNILDTTIESTEASTSTAETYKESGDDSTKSTEINNENFEVQNESDMNIENTAQTITVGIHTSIEVAHVETIETHTEIPEHKSNVEEVDVNIETIDHENEITAKDSFDSSLKNTPKQMFTVKTMNTAAHEKISSLLNDWDDNDAQEDDVSSYKNTEDHIAPKPNVANENSGVIKDVDDKNDKTNDNIKSLVSDWDDDEEESK